MRVHVAPKADTLVLIHSLTDSSYDDYTKYAIWLGRPVALKPRVCAGTAQCSNQARPGIGAYKI
jgi:aromatic ring-cleaving dioxygenase